MVILTLSGQNTTTTLSTSLIRVKAIVLIGKLLKMTRWKLNRTL